MEALLAVGTEVDLRTGARLTLLNIVASSHREAVRGSFLRA